MHFSYTNILTLDDAYMHCAHVHVSTSVQSESLLVGQIDMCDHMQVRTIICGACIYSWGRDERYCNSSAIQLPVGCTRSHVPFHLHKHRHHFSYTLKTLQIRNVVNFWVSFNLLSKKHNVALPTTQERRAPEKQKRQNANIAPSTPPRKSIIKTGALSQTSPDQ